MWKSVETYFGKNSRSFMYRIGLGQVKNNKIKVRIMRQKVRICFHGPNFPRLVSTNPSRQETKNSFPFFSK